MANIGLASERDPQAVKRMVNNWDKNQRPFDPHQKWQGMDFLHLQFIDVFGLSPLNQSCVNQKVDNDITAKENPSK